MINGVITKGIGGLYTVDTASGMYLCKPRGIFRKNKISPLVGDMVSISQTDEGEGIIETIHERRTELVRPKVANITQALIVFAYKEPDLHMDLLDRFIINCELAGVESIICFNKTDLIKHEEVEEFNSVKEIYQKAGYKVMGISACTNEGMEDFSSLLKGEITVLAGPSGAGKSSISNYLCNETVMETGILSDKIRRGKHTTRHSQLIKIEENSYIVDSPGFSSMIFEGVSRESLKDLFREFEQYKGQCRFLNCNHVDEPDCVIKQKVEEGSISRQRYNRYLSFFSEIRGD